MGHGIWFRGFRSFRLPTMHKTNANPGAPDWRDRKIREWLLVLLRFAVTRDLVDRSAALALADELDAIGLCWRPAAPSFFRRTSQEVCAAIDIAGSAQSAPILYRHITRIEDARLRRAFAAAVGLKLLPRRHAGKSKAKSGDLWKGLTHKQSFTPIYKIPG